MEALTNIGGRENFIFGETAEGVLVSRCVCCVLWFYRLFNRSETAVGNIADSRRGLPGTWLRNGSPDRHPAQGAAVEVGARARVETR